MKPRGIILSQRPKAEYIVETPGVVWEKKFKIEPFIEKVVQTTFLDDCGIFQVCSSISPYGMQKGQY